MKCYLGIDAGTSGVKVLILSEEGEVKGIGYKECDLITPKAKWVEQDPLDWWTACRGAIQDAVKKSGCQNDIAAIGFSGQMLGSTCLDKDNEPIGNCMIWLDQRATEERDFLEKTAGMDKLLDITSNYPLTGYWAPKLMWLKKNKPDEFDKIKTVLFPKDYLRYRLTGEIAVEVSDGAGSSLMDVAGRKWSDELFDLCGLPKEIVPQGFLESCDVAGTLKEDVARDLGLKAGIPVVAGGGDQPAGGIGNGIVREGVVSATIGTSGVVFAAMNKAIADQLPRAAMSFCHSVPGMWCFFGCTLGAGGSFKWLRDTMFKDQKIEMERQGKDVYERMTQLAASAKPGSEGLAFLPYLNGERTPYPDPDATGVFFGITYRHGLPEICRSVMEGVTFSLRDTIEILKEYDLNVSEVRASGGGAKSALWRQMQADIYNATVLTTNLEEGPSAGAAIMAAVGSGAFASVQEACDSILKITSRTEPDPESVKIYDDYYQTYRSLYPALKDRFAAQAKIVKKWAE